MSAIHHSSFAIHPFAIIRIAFSAYKVIGVNIAFDFLADSCLHLIANPRQEELATVSRALMDAVSLGPCALMMVSDRCNG